MRVYKSGFKEILKSKQVDWQYVLKLVESLYEPILEHGNDNFSPTDAEKGRRSSMQKAQGLTVDIGPYYLLQRRQRRDVRDFPGARL